MLREFRVFEKERDQRQAHSRFIALGKRGNEAGGLLVKRRVFTLPAQNKVYTQYVQGIRELIAGCRGYAAHN